MTGSRAVWMLHAKIENSGKMLAAVVHRLGSAPLADTHVLAALRGERDAGWPFSGQVALSKTALRLHTAV
ncbi:hypothetical protein [Mesorhizobium sp.]|uniref:hypothetical protein n=1 Tax=Mesorhizobium sp. TaxID=1871066 RepID=UPI0012029DB2|nr:hypothetical protein [Mesorhizobium sp.]TIR91627.1 MAG: hypothetical protein E5X08_17915 [Mesorhizobium sp.]